MGEGATRAEPCGALVAGGVIFALPEGARAIPRPGAVRPIPGAQQGLLGLALEGGRAVLVWALEPSPAAWVSIEGTSGPMVLGAAATLAAAPPGAPRFVLPSLAAASLSLREEEVSRAVAPSPSEADRAVPTAKPVQSSSLALLCGAGAVTVPFPEMDGVRPMPKDVSPVPGAPKCVLGYAVTVDGPVLLLKAGWCYAEKEGVAPLPDLVAVLRVGDRRLGVPCARVEPGAAGAELATRLSGTPDGRRAIDLAPLVRDVAPRPAEARRSLLLCRSAGLEFAVAAEEVEAVLQPQRPAPVPAGAAPPVRGACAHRGDVLPVLDAAGRLGPVPGRTEEEAPLLRLALPRPVALAVAQVLGLRSVASDAFAPVAGDRLVAAFAVLDGRPVPVCRAAAFAGAPP